MLFCNEKLKASQDTSRLITVIELLQATERLELHYSMKFLMEWYLPLTFIFKSYSKLPIKVSEKHVLNVYQFTSTV